MLVRLPGLTAVDVGSDTWIPSCEHSIECAGNVLLRALLRAAVAQKGTSDISLDYHLATNVCRFLGCGEFCRIS